MACTARALPFSVTVEQESFFLSRRLVQLHLQAEHRQCHVESEESTREFSDARNVSRKAGRTSIQVFSFPSLKRASPSSNDPLSQGAFEGPPWSCEWPEWPRGRPRF